EADARLRRAEEVRRLDVAVQDARLVRALERGADLVDHAAHEPEGKTPAERGAAAAIELGEIEAVDVLLHEERRALVRADVDRAHDARARDPRHEARLVAQEREGVLARVEQCLDHDRRGELPVPRQPYAAHAALAD